MFKKDNPSYLISTKTNHLKSFLKIIIAKFDSFIKKNVNTSMLKFFINNP